MMTSCGSSGSSKTATPATTATAPPRPTPRPTQGDPAASRAARLAPALLSASDLPPDLVQRQNQPKFLTPADTPGLTSNASQMAALFTSPDGQEFFSQAAVVPDDPSALQSMLDAFTPDGYLAGLTAGAQDAQAAPKDFAGAPPGARSFTYSATIGATNQHIDGEALAFVRGPVFVVLIHGFYQSPRAIDIGKIAGAIDGRIASRPDLT